MIIATVDDDCEYYQADDTIDEDVVATYCYMYSEFHVPDTYVVNINNRIMCGYGDLLGFSC